MENKVIDPHEFFYAKGQYPIWQNTDKIVSAMGELTPEYYDGAYVDKGLNWIGENNIDVIDKYRGKFDRKVFISHIGIAMQLLVRTVRMRDIPIYYVHKFKVRDYHIELLNRLYLDYELYDDAIFTGDKRPFGNSWLEGDIFEHYKREEYDKCQEDGTDDEFLKKNGHEAIQVYNEVIELAKFVIQTYPIRFHNFQYFGYVDRDKLLEPQREYYSHGWAPSISEFRDEKIDIILS